MRPSTSAAARAARNKPIDARGLTEADLEKKISDAYREAGLRTGLFVVLGFALAFGLTAFD